MVRILLFFVLTVNTALFSNAQTDFTLDVKELEVGNMLSWTFDVPNVSTTFVIERAIPEKGFIELGKIPANSMGEDTYKFLDMAVGIKQSTYRVRVLNEQCTNCFSKEKLVVRTVVNDVVINKMSDVRTSDYFNIELLAQTNSKGVYKLLDENRKEVLTNEYELTTGVNPFDFDLRQLPLGRYQLIFNTQNEREEIFIYHVTP